MKEQAKPTISSSETARLCSESGGGCMIGSAQGREMDWRPVIRHYRRRHLPNHRAEVQWFQGRPTLGAAIEKAALAEDHRGKRYSHQRRICRDALNSAFERLRSSGEAIRNCQSFDELHELIVSILKNIRGIGELYCYDTTLRIGAKLGHQPQTVFLHAGTRVGASALVDTRGKRYLTAVDLPPELRRLPPEQVEDILCIYKSRIKGLRR